MWSTDNRQNLWDNLGVPYNSTYAPSLDSNEISPATFMPHTQFVTKGMYSVQAQAACTGKTSHYLVHNSWQYTSYQVYVHQIGEQIWMYMFRTF